MRAVVITRPGGPEVLEIEERPVPTPGPNEILVRVRASALNRADLLQREGHYPPPKGAPPDIPGLEFAGDVTGRGNDVTEWREGDRVFGIVAGGGNAEYLVTDARCAARVPSHLSWPDAGAIPEAFMTAHDAGVMRAVVITRPGGPEVLEIEERPVPTPGPNEVLVRVRASALNRADLLQREGHYPPPKGAPPDIPGLEFAGEVTGLGSDVTEWRAGDRIFGIVAGGGNAEYLVTDARCAARVPSHLSWTDAAAIPEAFMTAHDALVMQADVVPGERVLIHAVGSGVGLAATQLARAWYAVPYGTARRLDKIERARLLGLEDGLVVGEDVEVIPSVVERWSAGKGIDVTLDLVGGAYLGASIRAAAFKGRIMIIGTVGGRAGTIPIGMVLGKRLTLRGTILRARPVEEKRAVTAAFVRDVVPLLENGAVQPTIDSSFDLADIRAAHERLASNTTFGKVVLKL